MSMRALGKYNLPHGVDGWGPMRWSTTQVAELASVDVRTVVYWVHREGLTVYRDGRCYKFEPLDVYRFLAKWNRPLSGRKREV